MANPLHTITRMASQQTLHTTAAHVHKEKIRTVKQQHFETKKAATPIIYQQENNTNKLQTELNKLQEPLPTPAPPITSLSLHTPTSQ